MKSPNLKWLSGTALCTLLFAGTAQAQKAATDTAAPATGMLVHLHQMESHPYKFTLQFINPSSEKVLLTIMDAQGNALFYKKVENNNFAQTFDLSTLQDGIYTFVLSKGKEMVKKTVQLNTDLVVVKKAYIR